LGFHSLVKSDLPIVLEVVIVLSVAHGRRRHHQIDAALDLVQGLRLRRNLFASFGDLFLETLNQAIIIE